MKPLLLSIALVIPLSSCGGGWTVKITGGYKDLSAGVEFTPGPRLPRGGKEPVGKEPVSLFPK